MNLKVLVGSSVLLFSSSFAALSGTFSILTYNVAGLPELLSSANPEVNTPIISPHLKPYNVINVQEDFNYHADLYANDTHAFRTATSGGAGIGSGLNTLSDFPFIDDTRVTWDDCDLNDGDCLTPKGFMFMRLRINDGLWVDLYNLHADAGADSGDMSARASNLQQLTDWITTWSAGMAIIVMGDTNSRYTTSTDSNSLHALVSSAGLTDSWVKNIRGSSYPAAGTNALTCPFPFSSGTSQATMVACEVVDKMLTRGSTAITLSTTSFSNENNAFVNVSGYPLTDHYPMKSTVSWMLSSSIRMGDPVGGPHGDPYNHIPVLLTGKPLPKITSITLRSGDRVDAVSVTVAYPTGTSATVSQGGTGGSPSTLIMNESEFIVQLQACQAEHEGDTRVFYVNFLTNQGRTLSGGTTTDSCSILNVPSDAGTGGNSWGLVGFWGRSGDELDRVAAIWAASY